MRNKILIFLCLTEILILLLFLVQALRFWLYPFLWGWPSEIHQQSIFLLVFVIIMAVATIAVSASSRFGIWRKMIMVGVLLVLTLPLGLFITIYLPLPPSAEKLLSSAGIDETSFSTLSPCDKVEVFTGVGYRLLDLGHEVVLVPGWMHESLRRIPGDVLLNCFKQVGATQISLMHGPLMKDEIPIMKVHALIFEASWLGIQDSPPILDLMRIMVCEKNYDPFERIAPTYYIAWKHSVPEYEYYSDQGRVRLIAELCDR